MPTRPKVLEFDVAVAEDGTAQSALGGSRLAAEDEWKAEHLVLAGLVRCTLASLEHQIRRAGLEMTGSGSAHGLVTRRDEDGMYAFVEVDAAFDVELNPAPSADAARELVERAERGCFVANSLRVRPRARWVVNGEELA